MRQSNPTRKQATASKFAIFFLFIILHIYTLAPNALAHKVFLAAYVEGDVIVVESGFSDGTSCDNAKIEVFDSSDNKLLEGRTDKNGVFSFKPPQKIDLHLVLDAGMGHRGEHTMPADELPELTGAKKTEAKAAPDTRAAEPLKPPAANTVAQLDPEEIELIVDKVIQKRLRPLIQLVAKSRHETGVSPTEIFGGIGYIMGLMGLAIYFKSRKNGKA